MDAAMVVHYDTWKANYVKTLTNTEPPQKWIKSDKSDSTVSEAMGYGMVIAAYMAEEGEAWFNLTPLTVPICSDGNEVTAQEYLKVAKRNIDKSMKVLLFSLKNGARCRVRTCDPIRVKDVLYH